MSWNTESKDPITAAVFRAIVSCKNRLGGVYAFDWEIAEALVQNTGVFLHSYLLEVEESTLIRAIQLSFRIGHPLFSLSGYPDVTCQGKNQWLGCATSIPRTFWCFVRCYD